MAKKQKFLWKSLKEGLVSGYGNFHWKIDKWEKWDAELIMCEAGFHASERIFDAIQWISPGYIAKVEVRGNDITKDTKQVWSQMRLIKAWKWTKEDSVQLAVFAAELVLFLYEKQYPDDDRPRKAIEAARTYLKNPNSAAYRAANAASADSAAYNAARAAGEIINQIENWLQNHLTGLEEI